MGLIEAVIKVGGSLAEDPPALRRLCEELGELGEEHRILIVPGGGRLADQVRELDSLFRLSDETSHRMAILAMDAFGLLLSELVPGGRPVRTIEEAESERCPILLPSKLVFEEEPFEPSWEVTSDSIAAYVAVLAGAEKLILAKDVDGIFTEDPKLRAGARLLEELPLRSLAELDQRCVDRKLVEVLDGKPIYCYVVNGKYPERVRSILKGLPTVCTSIRPTRLARAPA